MTAAPGSATLLCHHTAQRWSGTPLKTEEQVLFTQALVAKGDAAMKNTMRFLGWLMGLVIVQCMSVPATAQLAEFSNTGKEFFVGYGHHQFMEDGSNAMNMTLYFSNPNTTPAQVKITIIGSGSAFGTQFPQWTRTLVVPPGQARDLEEAQAISFTPSTGAINTGKGPIPKGEIDSRYNAKLRDPGPAGPQTIFTKSGILIEATQPINAYAHIYGSVSSGATMLLPTNTWGYEYKSLNSRQNNATASYSWLYVVAKEDNTKIRIIPSANTYDLNVTAGTVVEKTLNRGQIYQMAGQADANGDGVELTGTTVLSVQNNAGVCHPIAVFSGSSRTGNACASGATDGRDNDMQQLFPVSAWGKVYYTAPLARGTLGGNAAPGPDMINIYKIAVSNANAVVSVNGVPFPQSALRPGGWYYLESSQPNLIESDYPISVAQQYGGCTPDPGDPENIVISPIDQGRSQITFYRNTKQVITTNLLTIVVPTAALGSVRIDGALLSAQAASTRIATHAQNPRFSIVHKQWPAINGQSSVSCDSPFTAITYGFGGDESYGYNAGTFIKNLNAAPEVKNQADTSAKKFSGQVCTKTPTSLILKIAYRPVSIKWDLDTIKGLKRFRNDSLFAPVDYQTPDSINGLPAFDSVVEGGVKFYLYRADTGNIKHYFDSAGVWTAYVEAKTLNSQNCANIEKFFLVFRATPTNRVKLAVTKSICSADPSLLVADSLSAAYGIPERRDTVISYKWIIPTALPSSGLNDSLRTILAIGDNNVKFAATNQFGCVWDTSFTVTVTPGATADVFVSDTTICEGTEIRVKPTGTGTAQGYFWDFGRNLPNGTPDTITTTNQDTVVRRFDRWGTYRIQHRVVQQGNCPPSKAFNVHVFAKPNIGFTYPIGCLPSSGLVQFTDTTKIADTTTKKALWRWNFGDPNANAGNPNISTAQNPSHTYREGTYSLNFRVETDSGCAADTSFSATFAIAPAFAITQPAPLCENGDSLLLNFATVTNNVAAASKVYVGPGVDSATGFFRPSVAGPGVHELRLIYRTTGGICTDTAKTTIRVWAKPFAGFAGPSGGCLAPSGLAEFVGYDSTLVDGQTVSYKWKFGDTANVSPANIDSANTRIASHFYKEGGYTVSYQVTTNNGCRVDSVKKYLLSVSPDVALAALPSLCGSAAPVNLNQYVTINNNVNGRRRWYGNGLDSTTGIFNPAAATAGTQTIAFVYTSNGGCPDTAFQDITVYDLPNRGWTISPAGGCIGPDGKVTFTGNPYQPTDGQTLTYLWNFGDTALGNVSPANPNTANTRVASHIYKEGTYTIKYTVSTSFGCTFDSTVVQALSIKPDISLGALTAGCLSGDTVNLKNVATINNNVVGTYRFSGPGVVDSVNGKFVGNVAGPGNHTIRLIYTSNGGCSDTAQTNINMYQLPRAGFTAPAGCLPTNGQADFVATDTLPTDGQTVSYKWYFGDTANLSTSNPDSAITRNASHLYKEGGYLIRFIVRTNNGCTDTASINAVYGVLPALQFAALPAGCLNDNVLDLKPYAAVTNGVRGQGRFRGPGITDSVAGSFVGNVAGPGTHTIRYVFTTTNGCVDSISSTITMYAAPEVSFSYPTNCLNEVGFAEFFGNVQVPAGQTIVAYNWNFGDLTAGPGNPNTATTLNATHNYNQYDTFAIRFSATTDQGCVGDTVMNIPFSLKPNLNLPYQASICESDTAPKLLTIPTVLNNVPGTGYFTGTGVDSVGRFRAGTAGSGLRQVRYIFNSNFGCADTVDMNIKVFPKPTATLTVSGSVCEDATATLSGQGNVITVAGGGFASHRWTVEGRTWDTTYLGPLSYQFPNYGNRIVRFRAISDSGCVSDEVVDTVRVRDNPVASFTVPASVCLPNGTAAFVSNSTTQDGSAISTGTWGFGDGSNRFTTSNTTVTHTYSPAQIDSVQLTLEVTTQYGCVDDTAFYYKQFFEKPIASFRIEPDTFCQGTPTQIINTSVAPNSSLTSYFWEFGDGTTSTQASPTKAYSFPGDYPVTLAVRSQQGCNSDTTLSYNVRVLLQPRVDAGVNQVVTQGSTLQFLATTNDPSNDIRWTPPTGLNSDTLLRPTLLVTKTQLYYVQAENEGGCVAVDSVLVSVMLPFTIPNAFSPNGDGVNDLWAIPGLATYPGATMQVFNRSGAMVFNGQGVTSWDGTRNGSPVPSGTYYYLIDRKNGFPPITGYVVLLR